MTKQNKKTLTKKATATKKTIDKKVDKKTIANDCKKAPEQKAVDFKTEYKKSGDVMQALRLTREQRRAYAKQFFSMDNITALYNIASRLGTVGTFGRTGKPYTAELLASNNPVKTDLAKINTIDTPFNNKPRYNLTARQIFAILTAYFLRDEEKSFSRILPTGIFLENGVLRDLITSGYLTNQGGENTAQRFGFTDKLNFIFNDKMTKTLEDTLAEGGLI